MAIEFRDDWFYEAFWYVKPASLGAGEKVDWACCLYKESADPADPAKPWQVLYRFRYLRDARPGLAGP